ncbi:uncharacterized protein SCHCODRAFT_02670968 [Schizophyllum commune H4-8]|uniref:uncharacterized protein n=1 Tax=Schizophyllum commune (strain H4-8 / FGSC 9210) TaxID=578458 RepID=UPI00215F740E|nr:uncharacterized protein SCHCODRAFT_02670968 [Schizophyllum commune H4-8]KAI5888345.1 hypothetical protein SCHCODRAFT_02670968 [Schizophyllum commune H4-8]
MQDRERKWGSCDTLTRSKRFAEDVDSKSTVSTSGGRGPVRDSNASVTCRQAQDAKNTKGIGTDLWYIPNDVPQHINTSPPRLPTSIASSAVLCSKPLKRGASDMLVCGERAYSAGQLAGADIERYPQTREQTDKCAPRRVTSTLSRTLVCAQRPSTQSATAAPHAPPRLAARLPPPWSEFRAAIRFDGIICHARNAEDPDAPSGNSAGKGRICTALYLRASLRGGVGNPGERSTKALAASVGHQADVAEDVNKLLARWPRRSESAFQVAEYCGTRSSASRLRAKSPFGRHGIRSSELLSMPRLTIELPLDDLLNIISFQDTFGSSPNADASKSTLSPTIELPLDDLLNIAADFYAFNRLQ